MNQLITKPRYALSRYLIGLLPLLLVVSIIGAMVLYVINLNKSKLSYENDGETLIIPEVFSLDKARQDWKKLQNIETQSQKFIWLQSTLGPTNVGYQFEEIKIDGLTNSSNLLALINCFKVKKIKQYRVVLVPIDEKLDDTPLLMAVQVARQLIAQKHRYTQLSFVFYKSDKTIAAKDVELINQHFTLASSQPIIERWEESFFGQQLGQSEPVWSHWQSFSKQAEKLINFYSKDLD